MNKCKIIRNRILSFIICTEILLFSVWLIGGTVYNYVEKQQIEADIADLKSKMYRLEIMEEFNVTDSYLS